MTSRCSGLPFSEENDVSDHFGAFPLEGVSRQANRPQEIRLIGKILTDRCIAFVQREMGCHKGKHATGFKSIYGLGKEIVM